MSNEKEAVPARTASTDTTFSENTAERPKVKMTARDMVRKAKKDAARDEQYAEEVTKDKFNALFDEFAKLFPASLPVFVACHRRTKKPVAPWKGLTQENWTEPDHIRLLGQQIVMGGNLAIKLGSDSHNLVTVDLDSDAHVEPFLAANPAFRNTLQTRGSRGAQFWFIPTDDYPKEVRKLEIDGTTQNAGEFRGGRCLSTIWGVHENGNVYSRVNDVPPIKFAFGEIQWPTGWICIEPKNNFKFSGNGNHNTDRPSGSKRGAGRRIDWNAYDAEIAAQDGLVEILVEEYFDAKPDVDGWRCGDITGRPPSNKGSFTIDRLGRCTEWDNESHYTIMQAITSDLRDEKNTFEDVFTFLAEEAGLNFLMPPPDNQVILPQKGQQLKGEFAADVANVLKDEEFWFTSASKTIVRIDRSVETWVNDEGVEVEGRERLRLFAVSASEAESTLEEKVDTGVIAWEEVDGKKVKVFQKHSIDNWTARMLLKAPRLIDNLPRIDRVLDVTIPISIGKDTWLLPKPGYNRDLKLLLDTDIQLQEMPLQEAKVLLAEIVADFPFADDQSRTNWYARLITPMCRGIMGFNHRVPLFTFMGNRPRAGKDYLNGVAQTLFYGAPFEDPSISASSSEETRKRITTALSAGRRSMHIANQQAFLDDAVFIAAITAPIVHDRRLGKNDAEAQLEFRNELEFTMSGNVGLQWREDLTPRMRIINLSYFEEDANSRTFHYPNLHGYVRDNRTRILSALYTLVLHWKKLNCPTGGVFTSFPRWAHVVGGVVSAAELGDATEATRTTSVMGGDPREEAMRGLYEAAYKAFPEQWITTVALEAAFGTGLSVLSDVTEFWNHLQEKHDKMRFAKDMAVYDRRWLSGIRMILDGCEKKFLRGKVFFTNK